MALYDDYLRQNHQLQSVIVTGIRMPRFRFGNSAQVQAAECRDVPVGFRHETFAIIRVYLVPGGAPFLIFSTFGALLLNRTKMEQLLLLFRCKIPEQQQLFYFLELGLDMKRLILLDPRIYSSICCLKELKKGILPRKLQK